MADGSRPAVAIFRHARSADARSGAVAGRWPRDRHQWPETLPPGLRELGLPAVTIGQDYLRGALDTLLRDHAVRQRDYHLDKAKRLTAVHHNLDRMSEALFKLAIVSVAIYLLLVAGGALALIPRSFAEDASKTDSSVRIPRSADDPGYRYSANSSASQRSPQVPRK